jgi:hypothetical protein
MYTVALSAVRGKRDCTDTRSRSLCCLPRCKDGGGGGEREVWGPTNSPGVVKRGRRTEETPNAGFLPAASASEEGTLLPAAVRRTWGSAMILVLRLVPFSFRYAARWTASFSQ